MQKNKAEAIYRRGNDEACLIKPKELQMCGAQQEQLTEIRAGRYKSQS